MTPDLFGGIAAILYLTYLWLQLRSQAFESFSKRRVVALVLPALLSHLIYAIFLIHTPSGIEINAWSSAVLMLCVASGLTFYLYLVQGYRILALVVVPVAILVLVGSLAVPVITGAQIDQVGVMTHVLISMLAYATLALSAIQAAAIIALHQRLKRHDSTAFIKLMPPLQTVEATDMVLLWIGVVLLTLAIATGFVVRWEFVQQGNYLLHLVLALGCWVIYLALIAGKLWFGWRGLVSARLSLVAFAVLLVGYLGLKFALGYGAV